MPHAAARRALIALALALAVTGAAAQAMYKWVDEKGVTHFSESPPPDGRKASKIEPRITRPPAPAAVPRDEPEAWKAKDTEFRRRQIQRARAEEAEGREREKRAERCAKARQRLAFFEEPGAIYDRDESGQRVYLNDAQREAAIALRREAVREHCG